MIIDLRSDTVTKPTPAMLEAMMAAPVGDDVFGEDPTVNALEEKTAAIFGHEAGLFCPSGTMTNQIAINVHTSPGDEVICSELSHIYLYEGGGVARNSGASVRLLAGKDGRITAEQVARSINDPEAVYLPLTSMVSVEDTTNRGGGAVYDVEELTRISTYCREQGLAFHNDGARVFNALAENNTPPQVYGKLFDSISVCLSKGLGAPVGSVLLGSKAFVKRARRVRKVLGGGMRQAGYLAAAGIYALDHHVERLRQDHQHAIQCAELLAKQEWVAEVLPVSTNIIVFEPSVPRENILNPLHQAGVYALPFGDHGIRMVFHLDVTPQMVEKLLQCIARLEPGMPLQP
ncbi:MAG: threonine aldolase [Cryomorphaceae bacterium]|nr:MAG: threonine aldolase [Cryomorphaceae bacterium]